MYNVLGYPLIHGGANPYHERWWGTKEIGIYQNECVFGWKGELSPIQITPGIACMYSISLW